MKSLSPISVAIIAAIFLVNASMKPWKAAGQENPPPLGIVSAASFEAPVTADGIVAIFGTSLTVGTDDTPVNPLPTERLKRKVKVKDSLGVERDAPLFFASPGQINGVIPKDTATGAATVAVINTETSQTVSTGTVQVAKAAPAIFTANANGTGVPAAVALRIKRDQSQNYEPISYRDALAGRFLPLPIKPAESGERVFLILYLSGLRGTSAGAVKVLFGGQSLTPVFAPAPGFTGLDQMNVEIPDVLFSRGQVDVAVNVIGFGTSNVVKIETGCPAGSGPPQVGGYSPAQVLAGEQMTITGAGFDLDVAKNLVRIQGVEAKILSAARSQLTVRVPFGVESGSLSVCTAQGEGRSASLVNVKTSVSGFVEDTRQQPQPLAGVKVRLLPPSLNIETGTNAEGSFIMTNVPPSKGQLFQFDGSNLPGISAIPDAQDPLDVDASRDNAFPARIPLQQITGPSLQVVTNVPAQSNPASVIAASAPAQQPQPGSRVIQTEGIFFEVLDGTRGTFPDNSTNGRLTLTAVENSRTPIPLPPGVFSSSVAQITPFDVRLSPGAKLTFPNRDNIPPGTQATLYRFDQRTGSNTIGRFIIVGTALVSADGKRIETAQNAITDTSIYFVAANPSTTTVIGRVVDSDGETPVRLARVRSRGQEVLTDGNGGFVLRNLIASQGDFLTVDASFQRSSGKVDRAQTILQQAVVGGVTDVGPLKLSSEEGNRPPTILAPATLAMNINEQQELTIVVSDPDPNQTITVAVSGANFATITPRGNNLYLLKLTPIVGDAGTFTLTITAQDNSGGSGERKIALKVNRLPVANSQTVTLDEDTPRPITLTGSDPDSDPDLDSLFFIIVNNPAKGRLSGSAPNLIYTPNPNDFGTDGFIFKVNDGIGDSNLAPISISIRPVNDAPVLNVPGPQMVDEGKKLNFLVTATDVDESDKLNFSAANLPASAELVDINAISAEFRWTPSFDQAGMYTVTFTVRDNGGLSDSKTVMIKVNDVNRAPILTAPGPQMATSGQNLSFPITATDPDVGQTLTFSASNALPEGATFNLTNRQFNWTPRFLQVGNYDLIFKVTDNGSPPLSDEKTVAVTVKEQWTKSGLFEGGQVNALLCQGTNLFAGTEGGGIFLSPNQGSSWTQVLPNRAVRDFIVSGTTIFAGTFGDGVYRSTDQGPNWVQINAGLENRRVMKLAVSGATLYAGTYGSGVFRSTDQGQNWTPVNNGLTNSLIRALAVSGATIFAGTDFGGIFRSTDQGQNWVPVNTGLTNSRIFALTVSGSTIFAGTLGSGVFRSINNGQDWTPVSTIPPMAGQFLVLSLIVSGSNLFAGTSDGVYVSTDNGQSLTRINSGLETTVLSVATDGTNLFAGTDGSGVFRSSNIGQSWMPVNTGLTAAVIQALLASGTNLFAGTKGNGVYITSDSGQSWAPANKGLPPYLRVCALAGSSANLFAGTDGLGIYRSADQGQNWTEVNVGLMNGNVLALIVSGTDLFASTYGGVFRLTNQGQSWTLVNSGLEGKRPVRSFAASGMNLFVGTDGDGVFLSTNKGDSWTPVNSGLTEKNILAMVFRGTDLFVGTFGGVFRSPDLGKSWEPINSGLTDLEVHAFAVDGTNLFAGTGSGGVFLLPGNSQSWRGVNTGLTTTGVQSLAIGGTRIFAGTFGGGVFVGK